ncbi:tail fiber protein [Photorhabdus heterorhabditis]|uniref:tail fiber protein n=1 Tax=Photorhabdus heterorhabditis TaxID=880156 RepID=UPI0015621A71|nr:tail fiber protein [Photorhabdus heterorhabditis]NRN30513.1 tail fiber protein [Photorhabdus heterorhabditis subsp. aluminescens]
MEKKPNLSNVKSNMENIKSNGPSADDLKRRFKEGSIPLQTDYADLINIADIGRRAVGKAPGQTNNPNSALKLDGNDALAVKINENGGLKTDDYGLSVKIKNKSLLADNSGLAVNTGRGLKINNDKLEVNNHYGIEIVNEGVKVKAGSGIKVDNSGVSLKMGKPINNTYSPLILEPENDVLSVQMGNGLYGRDNGISVNPGPGIVVDYQHVSVKAGNGITVNSNGVSIDLDTVLPKGMIVMFSGKTVPIGWAFCDGKNGTPDLTNRFIMCGDTISETGESSNKASGSGSGKSYSRNTTPTQVSVSVNVQETTLTEAQIPSHQHIGGMSYWERHGMKYGNSYDTQTEYQIYNPANINNSPIWKKPSNGSNYYAHTSNTGGGQGHNHQATASSPSHSHSVDVIPPYYLLAFIMKI